MTMDYLDEATIEVAQPGASAGAADTGRRLWLEGAAALKNRSRDLELLQQFSSHENPLINAGSELLVLCATLSRLPRPDDLLRFRQQLKGNITQLKQQVARLDYPPSVADKSCFLFCIVLDEFILHCDWGEDSGWENQTLVAELFGMRDGGEQFYQVANKALAQPNLLLDLLELIYLFMRIGFRGQYRQGSRERLEQLQQQIETVIFRARPPVPFQANERIEVPVAAKPARPARFVRQSLLFVLAVGLVWGGTSYWYQNTFDQRSRDFTRLPEFSQTYLGVTDVKEAVYISTDEEMRLAARAYGRQAAVVATPPTVVTPAAPEKVAAVSPVVQPVTAVTDQARPWRVQLGTFSREQLASDFIALHRLDRFAAEIEPWRDKFRILTRSAERSEAVAISKQVRAEGISDAFVLPKE